jgi:hypothetical protein
MRYEGYYCLRCLALLDATFICHNHPWSHRVCSFSSLLPRDISTWSSTMEAATILHLDMFDSSCITVYDFALRYHDFETCSASRYHVTLKQNRAYYSLNALYTLVRTHRKTRGLASTLFLPLLVDDLSWGFGCTHQKMLVCEERESTSSSYRLSSIVAAARNTEKVEDCRSCVGLRS